VSSFAGPYESRYELRPWWRASDAERVYGGQSAILAASEDVMGHAALWSALREVEPDGAALSERSLARAILDHLERGTLVLTRRARAPIAISSTRREPRDPIEERAENIVVADDWIEIELVDADDRPVADEPFVLVREDGHRVSGQLDERGFARIEGIRPGPYELVFTRREPWEWRA
jgi:hypothetical protein